MNILAHDIEASNLNADFGIILTFGSKLVGVGSKVEVLRIDHYFTDSSRDLLKAEKRMLKDITKRIVGADTLLSHYGVRYDLPFINSRLLYHGLPVVPPNMPHIDTWKISRNHLKLRNNRLHTIQEFLRLEDEKNAILPEQWLRALGGDSRAIGYIAEHNRRDVLVLEQAYMKLRPLVLDHPSVALADGRPGCPVCGAPPEKQQKRGNHITVTRVYDRLQCQVCGKWHKSPNATLTVARATKAAKAA